MIDQLFEFVQNHPLLVAAFLAVLTAWLLYELRNANAGGVTTSEATQMVNREDAVILDVRDKNDFKAGHIAGARNIPQSNLDNRLNELDKVKSSPIVVVCKHGQSSGAVAAKLKKAGFERVFKLKGGMTQWQTDNLPIVKK
ncbi:rhodanese-like domain-containing protein [Halomonas denitrificans]|uniref:rhodanese-like domain-containing protein n=1 Tax=Halomonas TaxID=2745 RepID=UPI001A8FF1EF|nr:MULTISPECIES: rhodanese-like domain-containing protein [Halomonas]MED5294590.1 rhodanese-like domain-containing protein [Pseudomonadota bacterium]MBN8412840.1 rhodanese-like domain-containing protein [Halomonas litopenaei]MBY5925135.1 rhodanese-like domain-containing protein [Halomonas sp. DP4Y7-2]MBY5928968.1 rhodanese-like domain-containing protein [Halomonas sp. DP8Y7-3]MBY5968052.1 rhodanese-like domain-containing protein [Halomonas denitrificans]